MPIDSRIPLSGNAESTVNSIIASGQRRIDNAARDRQLDQADRRLDLSERQIAGAEADQQRQLRMQQTLQSAVAEFAENPRSSKARNQLRVLAPKMLEAMDEEQRNGVYEQNARNYNLFSQLGSIGNTLTGQQSAFVNEQLAQLQAAGELDGADLAAFADPANLKKLRALTMGVAMTNPLLDTKVRRALQAGMDPTSDEFQKLVGGDKGTTVNVNSGTQETAFDKEVGKLQAKHISGVLDDAKLARATLGNVTAMQSILEGVNGDTLETGTLTPFLTQAKALGLALGLELGDEDLRSDVARAQTFSAISMDLVAKARIAETKGSVSNREFDAYIASVAGLSQTVEGNRFMLKIMEKFARRKLAMGQFAGQVRDKRITMAQYEERVNQLAEQSVLTEADYAEMERLTTLGETKSSATTTPNKQAVSVGDVIDGFRFTGGNINDPASWQEVQ